MVKYHFVKVSIHATLQVYRVQDWQFGRQKHDRTNITCFLMVRLLGHAIFTERVISSAG